MGNVFAQSSLTSGKAPDPDYKKGPTFDPQFGFPEGRKERVMIATVEEMDSAKIPLHKRDYCAHLLLKFMGCRRDNAPFLYKCHHEKHEYLTCQSEDFVLRMKEYEREKRLLQRKHRIEARLQKENA